MQSTNISYLPLGLDCLQRNFPCYQGDPQYSSFSINCGGGQMRSSTGIVYEADDTTLGPATYYVTRDNKWAVSNAGFPSDNRSFQYTSSVNNTIINTSDPKLFLTAQISAGSLRYYGLGLENGNYSVMFQFAETTFPMPPRWRSVGTRVFNVYVQGTLQLRDFDIRRKAGGASLRAVVRKFIASMTENYLEIHLLWAGKGTDIIPDPGTYGPSISAISVTPSDFIPTVGNHSPNGSNRNRIGMITGIVVSVGVVIFFSLFGVVMKIIGI